MAEPLVDASTDMDAGLTDTSVDADTGDADTFADLDDSSPPEDTDAGRPDDTELDAGPDAPDPDTASDTDDVPDGPSPAEDWSLLPWSDTLSVPVDPSSGAGAPTVVPIDGTPRSVAVRAIPGTSSSANLGACYVFENVNFEGSVWVPDWADMSPALACTECEQRVSIGDLLATAVFRNDGVALSAGSLEFNPQSLDCARATEAFTPQHPGVPNSFDVQWHVDHTAITDPSVSIAVGIDPSTGFSPDSARLSTALQSAAARFADVGISLDVERVIALDSPAAREIYFGPGLMDQLNQHFERWIDEVVGDAERLVIPVFIVPCLVRVSGSGTSTLQNVFAGYTPRIPGGLSTREVADGVWLAVNDCPEAGPNQGAVLAADEPEFFGRLIAHELGHALGLYHSDQSFGEHVVDDFETNMMRSSIVFDSDEPRLRFDPAQVAVMTQHPFVTNRE